MSTGASVGESLYPEIKGQTDSGVLFYLAFTSGLADDPRALSRAVRLVEA